MMLAARLVIAARSALALFFGGKEKCMQIIRLPWILANYILSIILLANGKTENIDLQIVLANER